jgi:hypothetical protein
MKEHLVSYFAAEKSESYVFLAAALVALIVSVWLFASGNTYRGMAVPLVLVALIEIGVGGTIVFRTDKQVATLSTQLESEPARFKEAETARMTKTMAGFRVYKIAELAIFALGVGLTFALAKKPFAYSAGIGCIAQSSFLLVCDLFAEHRGAAYLEAVRELRV